LRTDHVSLPRNPVGGKGRAVAVTTARQWQGPAQWFMPGAGAVGMGLAQTARWRARRGQGAAQRRAPPSAVPGRAAAGAP